MAQKIMTVLKSIILVPHLLLASVEIFVVLVLEAESIVLQAHLIDDMVA